MRLSIALVPLFCAACGSGSVGDAAAPSDLASAPDRTLLDAGRPLDLAGPGDLATSIDGATPGDLAAPSDLTAAPDLAINGACAMHSLLGADCLTVVAYTNEWLKCHQACSSNQDCVLVSAHRGAGCKNACPGAANAAADGNYLQSLNSAFGAMNCGHLGCDCINPGMPVCKQQVCSSM